MSIWNKVLIGFVFLASVVFLYMAARTLKTHQYWRELAQGHQEQIDATEEENRRLIDAGQGEGEDVGLGIERLRLDLHKLLIDRGRVWYNCEPQQANPQTGRVAVTTDLPDPHQITEKTLLYVFEETDVQEQGSYLGEFKVTAAPEKERVVQLEPSMKPTQRELERLGRSKGPWTLYEIMPIDNHDIFADLDQPELTAILPQQSVVEYLRDGQDAEPDDPQECKVDGKYVRKLRDYEVFFKWYHLRRSILFDLEESAERDYQYAKAALNDSQRQLAFREEEVTRLKKEKAQIIRERDATAAHRKLLEAKVAAYRAAVARLIAGNKSVAGRITNIQLDATRRIDARTQRVAQSAAGGN